MESGSLQLENKREDIDRAEESVLSAVQRANYPDASGFAIRLAMEEAIVNAFKHGHDGLPPNLTVWVRYVVRPDDLEIEVEDQGPGFAIAAVPDPTLEQNLERVNGRGIMLMRAFMTSVEYAGRGNIVRMVYHRPE